MKTRLKNYKLIIVLLLMISLPSCSNDDGNSTSDPTVKELLIGMWFYLQNENISTSPSEIEVLSDCVKKTYLNFLVNGTLLTKNFYIDGGDNCASTGITDSTYILSADGKQIVVNENDEYIIFVISSISNTNLVLFNFDNPQLLIEFKR